MKALKLLLFLELTFILPACGGGHAFSQSEPMKDLTLTISGNVRGIMGRTTPHQEMTYHFQGTDFITSMGNGIKTKKSIDFAHPPLLNPALLSDPFAVVGALGYFSKQGDRAAIRRLIEPGADAKLVAELNTPAMLSSDAGNYKGATGLDILFGFQAGNRFVVFYLIENPGERLLQVDELSKIGTSYFLRVQEPAKFDYTITNLFTAFFAELHGEPGSVTVSP